MRIYSDAQMGIRRGRGFGTAQALRHNGIEMGRFNRFGDPRREILPSGIGFHVTDTIKRNRRIRVQLKICPLSQGVSRDVDTERLLLRFLLDPYPLCL